MIAKSDGMNAENGKLGKDNARSEAHQRYVISEISC